MGKKNNGESAGIIKSGTEKIKSKLGIIGEFKKFISRGNVLDMAVGLIIGTAFTAIVNSMVKDILMPLLGMITGKVDFSQLKIVLQQAVLDAEGTELTPEVAVNYGAFIQYIINFFFVALAVFLLVKLMNTLKDKTEKKKKEEEKAAEAVKPDPQIVLLTEIRDLLKNQDEAK